MKVIHFTNNVTDGAGRAVYRLHKALLNEGLDSLILVANKGIYDDTVFQIAYNYNNIDRPVKLKYDFINRCFEILFFIMRRIYWELKIIYWKPKTLFNFDISYISFNKIRKHLNDVDIICLYSIQSFLSTNMIKKIYEYTKAPIVWTPMDIEPLTGGCHFNNGCNSFNKSCGNCPQLGNSRPKDITYQVFKKKIKNLNNLPITLVACTSNILDYINKSVLFKDNPVAKILIGVEETIYAKVNKDIARSILKLPKIDKIILFGGFNLDDNRHGGKILLDSLNLLWDKLNKSKLNTVITLVTIGRRNGFDASMLPIKWIHLGEIKDDRILSLIYQASDIYACSTIDSFGPMMINEAFMCGVKIAAFESDTSVAKDFIISDEIGYLSENNIEEFSKALLQCILDNNRTYTNDVAYSLKQICKTDYWAKQYYELFKKLKCNT